MYSQKPDLTGRPFRGVLFLFLICLLAAPSLFSQQREPRRPVPSRPAGPSVGSTPRPTVRSPAPSPRPSVRTTNVPSVTSAPRPRPDRFPSGGGGGGSSVPVQTYSARPYFSASDWYRCNSYLAYLWHEYRFLPVGDYLWRYAQGDSPLTDQSVDYALKESSRAAGGLVASTEALLASIDRYEKGGISDTAFEATVKQQTKEIRDHAKKIRKDHFLDYLDQRQTKLKDSYDKAQSVAQLRQLAMELRGLAFEIDMGLRSFVEEDLTRTVDVNHLQRPTFDSLSKQVDKLAKVIEKSSRDL